MTIKKLLANYKKVHPIRTKQQRAAITHLATVHGVSYTVARYAYRYLMGKITPQGVAQKITDIGQWYLFCRVIEKESGVTNPEFHAKNA